MRMFVNFKKTAGSNENLVMASQIARINVKDANTVIVFIKNADDLPQDSVELTTGTSNNAPAVALRLAEEIANGTVSNGGPVLTVVKAVAPFADVDAVGGYVLGS